MTLTQDKLVLALLAFALKVYTAHVCNASTVRHQRRSILAGYVAVIPKKRFSNMCILDATFGVVDPTQLLLKMFMSIPSNMDHHSPEGP